MTQHHIVAALGVAVGIVVGVLVWNMLAPSIGLIPKTAAA